jgi:cobalt/nickel transport system permease protein
MSDLKNSIIKINSLEELSFRDTMIHRLHPAVKLLTTVIYLVIVISFPGYEMSGLLSMVFFPVLCMVLGEIPLRPLCTRLLVALPFTFFAGLSNLFLDREVLLQIGALTVTGGVLGFCSIMIKTVLTVTAILILIATTSMKELLQVLHQFKLPPVMILQLTMTFRYLELLANEALVMYHAYILRAPGEKGIRLKDMGAFLGQLLLRSFGRAERVYYAMKCRGFEGEIRFSEHRKLKATDWSYLLLLSAALILLRSVNISKMIGNLFV